jgi:hypothetical protein
MKTASDLCHILCPIWERTMSLDTVLLFEGVGKQTEPLVYNIYICMHICIYICIKGGVPFNNCLHVRLAIAASRVVGRLYFKDCLHLRVPIAAGGVHVHLNLRNMFVLLPAQKACPGRSPFKTPLQSLLCPPARQACPGVCAPIIYLHMESPCMWGHVWDRFPIQSA